MRSLAVAWGVAGLIVVAALGVLLIPDVVRWSVTAVFYTAVGGLGLATVIVLTYSAWAGVERILLARAQRHKLEHEADVMTVTAPGDHRAWLHMRRDGAIHNLSLDARLMIEAPDGRQPTGEEQRAWQLYHQLRHAPRMTGAGNVPLLPEAQMPAVDILTTLRRTQRGLIVGNSDAGKSTVLRWLARERHASSQVVVIDPHAYVNKWPGCIVVGRGRRYDLIDRALDDLLDLMDRRYKKLAYSHDESCGEAPVTVIVDEWLAISRDCDNARSVLIALLTESRKVAMYVYVGCHSDSVKSLGLDGQGDLREGFEIYHIEVDQQTSQRRAWLEIKRRGNKPEIIQLSLPGPYAGGSVQQLPAPGVDRLEALDVEPDAPLMPEPGSVDELVVRLAVEGRSKKEISEAAWGAGKFGSFYNEKIDEILNKYGVRS